jgi:flagellin-like hook-associated protein FlgL
MTYRVSTQLLTNNYLNDLRRTQVQMERLLKQSQTGKAFERPRDNPSAVSTSLNLKSAISAITQYNRNVDDGKSRLDYTETNISEVDTMLQRARELTVQASNTYLTQTDRNAIALELDQLMEHIVSLSNASYRGRYIYSGYETLSEAFQINSNTADGLTNSVTYRGDMGSIARNIGTNRDLAVNFIGKDVFLSQTYELNGRQLSGQTLGYNGAFELNDQLFIVTPGMTVTDIRDMINKNTKCEVFADVSGDYRLSLTSLNSSNAIRASDISGSVLDDLGILPRGAYNYAQAAPAAVPMVDSRGAIHEGNLVPPLAFPLTLGTANQDMVVTLAGAANDNFTQTEVLKLDAKTYNSLNELQAEIQKKADSAFGEERLLVNTAELPPLSGNFFLELETYAQNSNVMGTDLRVGGTAPDGTVDTASALLGFNAVAGVEENADTAGVDGNDRFIIDLGLTAYITTGAEAPLNLDPVELNLDATQVNTAGVIDVNKTVDEINRQILNNKYLSGLVHAENDSGRLKIVTTKKDGSIAASDMTLSNAVGGVPVPATDTLGSLGFYVNQTTGESAPPVPATVFGTAVFPLVVTTGINDRFRIDLGPSASLDGTDPPAVDITLGNGVYAAASDLALELNNQFSLSATLKDRVYAVVNAITGAVDIVTAETGSKVQSVDLTLTDITPGALANIGLNAPTTPGGGTTGGQGDITEAHNMIDTLISTRDELFGYAAPESRLVDLLDESGNNLGLFPGYKIVISSDGTSKEFVVQRFTTMQDLADQIESKLGFQLEVKVLRDGTIQIFNPTSTVVNDVKIEAFDGQGATVDAFNEKFASISGRMFYRTTLSSQAVSEDERFQNMTDRIADVDDAFETVLSVLAQLGSKTKRLEMTLDQNENVSVNLSTIQTSNDFVDLAEIITRLKEQENVLNAALGIGSRILPATLFDYLS